MESENNTSRVFNNTGYTNAGVLNIRLNTEELIQRIEDYLSGSKWIPETLEDGRTIMQKSKTGTPLANPEGVQSLTNYVSGVVNPAVVQGNYSREQYENAIYFIRLDLIDMLSVNFVDWEVKRSHRSMILSFIMNLIEPFLSRLIDNKERESYSDTIRSVESSRVERDKRFGLFGNGGGEQ